MKIYLDNCVLNRPSDDQTQERIFLETQAFLIILKRIEEGKIELVSSFAIEYEMGKISEWERKEKIRDYLKLANSNVLFKDDIKNRALVLTQMGIMGMDALHISAAESANVDYFITCDDQLLKAARRNKNKIKIKIVSLFELTGEIYHA